MQVSFQWTNPDFLSRNPDFLLNSVDFLVKSVDFIIKQGNHSKYCELQHKCQLCFDRSIENAEIMENCPWKMMIFYRKNAPILLKNGPILLHNWRYVQVIASPKHFDAYGGATTRGDRFLIQIDEYFILRDGFCIQNDHFNGNSKATARRPKLQSPGGTGRKPSCHSAFVTYKRWFSDDFPMIFRWFSCLKRRFDAKKMLILQQTKDSMRRLRRPGRCRRCAPTTHSASVTGD